MEGTCFECCGEIGQVVVFSLLLISELFSPLAVFGLFSLLVVLGQFSSLLVFGLFSLLVLFELSFESGTSGGSISGGLAFGASTDDFSGVSIILFSSISCGFALAGSEGAGEACGETPC